MSDVADTDPIEPSPPKPKPAWRTYAVFALKLVLSAGLLWAVALKVKPTFPRVVAIDWPLIALAVTLLAAQVPLIAARWRILILCFGGASRFFPLLRATWVSVLAGQFLPASVGGDLIRVLYARAQGQSLKIAAVSVIVDRMIALVAIAILAVVFCPFLFGLRDPSVVMLTAAVAVGGILCVPVLAWLAAPVQQWSQNAPWLAPLAVLLGYVRTLLQRRADAGLALGLALLVHLLSAAALFLIARSLAIAIDPLHLTAVSVVIVFAMALPISLGGWGVREAVAVALMGFFGVPGDAAFVAAVLLGAGYAAASMPGALLWLDLRRAKSASAL